MKLLEKRNRSSVFGRVLGCLEEAVQPTEADREEIARRLERVRALGGAFGLVELSERLAAGPVNEDAALFQPPTHSLSA